MAVKVYISHSGQSLTFDDATNGIDALRAFIEHHIGIPPTRQILMTPRGKNIKSLTPDVELFVYDKRNLSSSAQVPTDATEQLPALREPPILPEPDATLGQWKDVAKANRSWAIEANDSIRAAAEKTESLLFEAAIVSRSALAALDNVKNYFQTANHKFDDTRQWARDSLQEHNDALNDWKRSYDTLAELPVRDEVASILKLPTTSPQPQINTLADLLDLGSLQMAEQTVRTASEHFKAQLEDLQNTRDQLRRDTVAIEQHVIDVGESDVAGLTDEAEVIAKRVNTDYDEIIKLRDDARSLAQATRKGTAHARELLPGLQGILAELDKAFHSAADTRRLAIKECFAALRGISGIQSRLSALQGNIAGLDFTEQDSLESLYHVFQLPAVYGCTLIEATRRSEWTNKMQAEVDSLHNDLSQMTEDEQRKRRKWMASYGDFLNKELNSQDTLIDIKASKPRNAWPFVERDEIGSYIDDLRALEINDAVETVLQRMKDLESAVRRPRPKAFKNGSVQDLAASASVTGDMRALQEDKARLEDKVKASESRVRKLEDLLHRQSQVSRPGSGVVVPGPVVDFGRHSPSPGAFQKHNELPQRPSISLRRYSNGLDEKAAAQKISALESQVQKLQEETTAERRSSTESRDKMQEAESVKQDLMANFEAQRQEFEEERQILDDERHNLKIRIEELEDELDRILGSRDHMKLTHDQKITDLRLELDELRETHRSSQEQAQVRTENLERDLLTQRDRSATLERQLQECRDERNAARNQNMDLANRLRAQEEEQQDLIGSLQVIHSTLSPAGSAPDDLKRLARALEILSEGAAIHARGLDDSLQLATAENKSLEDKLAHLDRQLKSVSAKTTAAEARSSSLNETLEHERNKLKAVRDELQGTQTELDTFRAKLAAGETGSDALRERLAEEEKRVAELQELKYENESSIQGLKSEMDNFIAERRTIDKRLEILRKKLDSRGEKAKQLSERLFQYNDRIVRMLEQFGFSISRHGDDLLIQRASKVSASMTLPGMESSVAMKRTVSGSVPSQHYSDPTDLETLYWTSDTETTDEESKYRGFLTALQRLELDGSIDTVVRRYKDIENLAKKYQKDARAYRERAHRLQSEAHDKIAYRSFKDGDLALFLPTRNQATRPWAAFNVGAPHYFLREQDHHKLQSRDWLLARISRVEERVVDLSRSLSSTRGGASIAAEAGDSASARSMDDENPFELSDGLRWYMIDAAEEKPGAPGTPSVGKSTVIASNVEAEAMMGNRKDKGALLSKVQNAAQVTKTLNKSLESRRSSSASKRSGSLSINKKDSASFKDAPSPLAPIVSGPANVTGPSGEEQPLVRSTEGEARSSREEAKVFDIVRQDLLQGP
jgi:autophagy-related protein 11